MKKYVSKFLVVLLTLSMLTGLAACGSVQPSNETGGNAQNSDEPAVLTVLMENNDGWIKNFSPLVSGCYQVTTGFMFEPLVIFDSYNNNKETMWLAEDIISEPDNKTLTIKVRQGVKWSDGEDFNADDVAFTFLYSKDHSAIDRGGDWGENGKFESVSKIDEYTVQIVMKEANRFHRNSVFNQRWMLPEHVWSQIDNPESYIYETDKVVCTGPFSEVLNFSPEMMEIGRNPNYWKADDLQVDVLRIPQFNGNDGAMALLATGAVDWAHVFIPDIEKNYIQGDPNRHYWYGPADAVRLAINYMTPNTDNLKAFNNVDFKRAMSMAIDRQGIIDSAVYGYLSPECPSNTGLSSALSGYESDKAQAEMAKYTQYDLEGAKSLLEQAGFKDVDGDGFVENLDGSKIVFNIVSPAGWTDWNDGASICAQGLQEIGINATAKAMDIGLITEAWDNGSLDVSYSAYGLSSDIWRFYYDTIGDQSRIKTPTWWSICQTNYANDEITDLVNQMSLADSEEAVKAITDKIEEHFAENMINIPILFNGNWFVYNTQRFTGWATEDNVICNPANCIHDSKLLQLMALEPVK